MSSRSRTTSRRLRPLANVELSAAFAVCHEVVSKWGDKQGLNVRSLRPLKASTKSQVFQACLGSLSVVIKRHSQAQNYWRERFALELLSQDACVPMVYETDDDRHLLISQYVSASGRSGLDPESLGRCLARLHGINHARQHALLAVEAVVGPWRRDAQLNDRTAAPKQWNTFMRAVRAYYGESYQPVSVIDIKAEHFRRLDGRLVFVDLDSFTIGVPEPFDLLATCRNIIGRITGGSRARRDFLATYAAERAALLPNRPDVLDELTRLAEAALPLSPTVSL